MQPALPHFVRRIHRQLVMYENAVNRPERVLCRTIAIDSTGLYGGSFVSSTCACMLLAI